MRDGSAHTAEALSCQGRYQQIRDNLRVKQVEIASTPGVRWISCHYPDGAERYPNRPRRGDHQDHR